MKILLKDFQVTRTEEFVSVLRRAVDGVRSRDDDYWAVSLASPTGSGKTVMMTAAIEAILAGDEEHAPDPEATFLWITDQPELNEQTWKRMLETSTELRSSNLVVLDTDFEQPTFDPGTVYFLNTQKLSKNANLVNTGDARTITLWETVQNTVEARRASFFVLIDEAHRGMQKSKRDIREANSIVQKFILGSDGEIPPIPLITGISATPDRFNKLVEGANRWVKQVVVSPEEVRSSGLLKDAIEVFHPTENQPADVTMLQGAVRQWQDYTRRWAAYCKDQDERLVEPLLAIQVEDAPKGKKVSKTDLDRAMRAIESEAGPLPDEAFGHALQDKVPVTMNGREVRYIAPSDIQDDPDVRVVFFKTSLNTGWDCPRAEVMMSYRTAKDPTHIAQLIGRMVRTPLARRVDADEHLNTVALFLPHFDEGELEKVISYLSSPDPDVMPTVEIRKAEESVTLQRAPGSEAAFAALSKIPSYVVPSTRNTSEIARLMKLARRLAYDRFHADALEDAEGLMLGVLRTEYDRFKDTDVYKGFLDEDGKLDVAAVRYEFGKDGVTPTQALRYDTAAENVEDLFAATGRKIGEGLHKAWWKARVAEDRKLKVQGKLELGALLAADPAILERLKDAAQKQTDAWLRGYRDQIRGLDEGDRQAYEEIRGMATEPEETTLSYPDAIDVKKEPTTWPGHLYVDASGAFPAKLNKWEARTIEAEMRKPGFVGWLRNTPRKSWALRIPYEAGSKGWKSHYPDFLVVREEGGKLVVDVFEPHDITRKGTIDKVVGLARFAKDHFEDFGRIELIIIESDVIKPIDLGDPKERERMLDVKTTEELRRLFE